MNEIVNEMEGDSATHSSDDQDDIVDSIEQVEAGNCERYLHIIKSTVRALKIDCDAHAIDLDHLDADSSKTLESLMLSSIEGMLHAGEPSTESKQDWHEYTEEHPMPSYGLDSPIVMNVLNTWTSEEPKKRYFLSWAKNLLRAHSADYPTGIQITGVSKVIRDAFLMLILPLLKRISLDHILATVKEYQVFDAQEIILSPVVERRQQDSADPFVDMCDTVYDIRFKRLATSTNSSRHVSRDFISSTEPHFCCDSSDYSTLAEINTVFKDLEKQVKDEMLAFEAEKKQKQAALAAAQAANANADAEAGWIGSISSWFSPGSKPADGSRWSSFSGTESKPSIRYEDTDVTSRRSVSFSATSTNSSSSHVPIAQSPLEIQAHMMSSSMLINLWAPAPLPPLASTAPAAHMERIDEQDSTPVSSASSSRSGSMSIKPDSSPASHVVSSAIDANEKAARNKDKIAARLAALREKQQK